MNPEQPKMNAEPQQQQPKTNKPPKFKTGTVAYKIEKTFYDFLDSYNETKQLYDEFIQLKNKQSLQTGPQEEQNKSKGNLEEVGKKLKKIEDDFAEYINKYLTKYKEDQCDYNEIYFPPKRTPNALVEVIGAICKKLDIFTDLRGPALKKTISIYKTRPLPRADSFEGDTPEQKPLPPAPTIQQPKSKQQPEEDEEEKSSYKFPPDPIKTIKVKSITAKEIEISITIPDDNNAKITKYSLNPLNEPALRTSPSNTISLSITEDIPKLLQPNPTGVALIAFELSAENSEGESKKQIFKLLINFANKLKCLIKGKDIPIKGEVIEDTDKFVRLCEGHFDGAVNQICLNNGSLMLLDDGTCIQWGYSVDSDQIEVDTQLSPSLLSEMISSPFCPLAPLSLLISSIACGSDFSLALTSQGELFSWGRNEFGQLGVGDFKARVHPTKVKVLVKEFTVKIAAGNGHALAVSERGEVYCWGYRQGEEGQPVVDRFERVVDYENLGFHQPVPRRVSCLVGERVLAVYCGGFHNIVICESGPLSWGDNEFGQLGTGFFDTPKPVLNSVTPRGIVGLKLKKILRVSCGDSHTLMIVKNEKGEEEILGFGRNAEGQLGCGDYKNKEVPVSVKKTWKGATISIGCSNKVSLFLNEEKEVFWCGEEKKGKVKEAIKMDGVSGIEDVVGGGEVLALLYH